GLATDMADKVDLADITGLGTQLPWGSMGENLTLAGLLETDVWLGDVLEFANCRLRVEQPREPCFKFNAAMGFNTAAKAMVQSGFCGFYLSVLSPGSVQRGETFTLVAGPRRVGMGERIRRVLGVG
ncbi:MAG: MOSC domain-containing protein, partial [Rhodoferax sp.]|nr:MOSC domain-containing protein [Rhodoferax sp.]